MASKYGIQLESIIDGYFCRFDGEASWFHGSIHSQSRCQVLDDWRRDWIDSLAFIEWQRQLTFHFQVDSSSGRNVIPKERGTTNIQVKHQPPAVVGPAGGQGGEARREGGGGGGSREGKPREGFGFLLHLETDEEGCGALSKQSHSNS